MVESGRGGLPLGGETLAALCATAREDFLTAGRQHPLAKSMATLANNAARLIRALHGTLRSKWLSPPSSLEKANMLCFPMLRKAERRANGPGRTRISPEFEVL
jgi:hypothetical protein